MGEPVFASGSALEPATVGFEVGVAGGVPLGVLLDVVVGVVAAGTVT